MRDYLQIELHTYCGADCAMCPNSKMPRAVMDEVLLRSILEQATGQCKIIVPFGTAEPLHPKGNYNLALVFEWAQKNNVKVFLTTNGQYLHARLDLLKKYAAQIAELTFSWMGYTSISSTLNADLINLGYAWGILAERIAATGGKCKISVFKRYMEWLPQSLHDYAIITEPHNYLGYIAPRERTVSNSCIWREQEDLIVLVDGRCVPCCLDYAGDHVVGDLRVEKLADVWARHAQNCQKGFPICAKCSLVNTPKQLTEGGVYAM